MKCSCGASVTAASAWHKITGWEQDRQQGGTNAVALRERTGEVMCNGCMAAAKAGVSPQQGQLA